MQLREEGVLAKVLEKVLEAQYPMLRKQNPKAFLHEKGEWKPFQEVKLALIEASLTPLFRTLDERKTEVEKQHPSLCQWTNLQESRFALYFLPLVLDNKKKMEEGAQVTAQPISYEDLMSGSKEPFERAMSTMCDFIQSAEKIQRNELERQPELKPLFSNDLKLGECVLYMPQSGLSYVKVVEMGQDPCETELREVLYSLDDCIGNSARREKIERLLYIIKDYPSK